MIRWPHRHRWFNNDKPGSPIRVYLNDPFWRNKPIDTSELSPVVYQECRLLTCEVCSKTRWQYRLLSKDDR